MRLLLPLFFLISTTVHAEGLYVEAGSLARRYDLTVPGASNDGSAKGHVLSPLLRLGYEFDEHWAVEAGYASFGSPGQRYRLGGQEGEVTAHGHSGLLAGRGRFALGERWALVGRLGLARNQSSLSGTGEAASRAARGSTTALYASLGVETTLANHWQLGLAWEHLGMNREKGGSVIHGISTTLRYKF